jgi:hypothetical protein
MRRGLGIWAIGLGVTLSHAAVDMNIGQCLTGQDQPVIDFKNSNPDPWDMHAFKATVAGNVLGADFPTAGSGTSIVLPGDSPTDPYFFSCGGNVGSFYNKQLESKIGSCNEPDPPEAPLPLRCLDGNDIVTTGDYYNANKCIQDGLGVNRGDGYGGFIDSYRDQTQIQVAIPSGSWQVGGKTVSFDPAASMGGPFYMMSLVALQEYLYVDMQFMLALGASTSGAGLVDASTRASLYQSPLNVGNDQAPYGSFNMTYLTATGRIMADYPKYFATTNINKLVSTNGSGPTLANSPQQLNSAFLGAMNLWWLFDGLKSAQDLCFRQFLKDAKDKAAGLKLMLGGWYIGPNAIGTATTATDDYATHVLPTTSAAILTDDDVTDKMKHFPYGQGTPDYDTPNYVTYVFTTLNKLVDANKTSTACGGALQIYDAAISRQQVKELFFGQGGTAATQGNGGLLLHFNIPAGDRQKLWNDLDCAFDKLKGKNGRGAEEISYRYDFLTILRVARQYFGGFVNKFSDRPTPPSAYSSEYSIWVTNHSKTPCTRGGSQDSEWPTLTLADTLYSKGQKLAGTMSDNKGIKEYAYTTDLQWRKWTATDQNFAVPPNLAANTRLWFRITDSCGNATIQEVIWRDVPPPPPLPTPVASPKGTSFYDPITVAITDSVSSAQIHYTLDGTDPTAGSPLYTGPITISSATTLKAIAIPTNSSYGNSGIMTETYTKSTKPLAAQPVISPQTKQFLTTDPAFPVTITTTTAGASIFYSTDGNAPDTMATARTKLYTGPIQVNTTLTIIAIAVAPAYLPSPSATGTYTATVPPANALSGVLRDDNGDGKIDRAVVTFDKILPALPAKLSFTVVDQTGKTGTVTATGSAIAVDGVNSRVTVTLAPPLDFGITSVGTGSKGQTFAQSDVPLGDKDFPLTDEAPPVILEAHVFESDSTHPLKRIVVKLSEPISAPLVSQTAFVFKRGDNPFAAADIKVTGIKATGNNEYTIEIDSLSPKTPVRLDFIAINTLGEIKDTPGNAPKIPLFQPLIGDPVKAKPSEVKVLFYNEGTDAPDKSGPQPMGDYTFIPVDENGNAMAGSADGKCGPACSPGGNKNFVGPVFVLDIPGPLEYEFQIFNNFGEFVAKGKGKILEADLASLKLIDSGKKHEARIVWTGRTDKGGKAGTGVYILQSTLRTAFDEKTGADPSTQTQRVIFGLMRHSGGS